MSNKYTISQVLTEIQRSNFYHVNGKPETLEGINIADEMLDVLTERIKELEKDNRRIKRDLKAFKIMLSKQLEKARYENK